jgi:hypothetical protein
MNPSLFIERVVETIRRDFDIFARDPGLPQVKTVVMQSTGPDPYVPVMGTGSRK